MVNLTAPSNAMVRWQSNKKHINNVTLFQKAIDSRALAEQQEQWTANRRFIFLFPSSRLAHKVPVMQATVVSLSCLASETGLESLCGSP